MGQGDRSELAGIRLAAAEWVVRLSDPESTSADRAAFEAWRAQSPHHEAAYERELAAWERLDRLRALGARGEIDPNVIRPPGRARASFIKIAAGAVLALALGGAVAFVATAPPAYATGIGERRVVVLEDGSRVELNTNSKIVVRYRDGVREVSLERGEALFQVAQGDRPFVIVTSQARVAAGASELSVRLRDEGLVVQVSGGKVALQNAAGGAAAGRIDINAGQEAAFQGGDLRVQAMSLEEIGREQAWRQGSISLDGRTLGDAIDEFNRYNRQKLVLTDESLSGLRLGGYFSTSDIDGFSSALTNAFHLSATERENGDIYIGPKT